jgi:hypothetical protein
MVSLLAIVSTLNPATRKKAFFPDYDSTDLLNDTFDDCLVVARVLRLFSLESYILAIHILKNVIRMNRKPLMRSFGALVTAWFIMATLLHMFEKDSANINWFEPNMPWRYRSLLSSLQYSIVHMFGDYPEADYTVKSRVVHFFGIMMGVAIIAVFTGIFSAVFVN